MFLLTWVAWVELLVNCTRNESMSWSGGVLCPLARYAVLLSVVQGELVQYKTDQSFYCICAYRK